MAKFSGKTVTPKKTSPLRTIEVPSFTYEGGIGYERDSKSELFLLAVSNMVKQNTFYESGKDRDSRFKTLAHKVTQEDPDWVANFVPYLRNTMQMRSASIVLAAHYVAAGGPLSRSVVNNSISRADEPAEILAYYAQEYGKNFPMPLKRGVADAVKRVYNERSVLKYDGQSRSWRMADVINLTHPKPVGEQQSDLFKWILDCRYDNKNNIPESLQVIKNYQAWQDIPVEERRKYLLENKLPEAITWESLSGWLQGPMDAEAWETVIPNMGYMALLRNLRNFEDAKVKDEILDRIAGFLSDKNNVLNSRQFPIRFYSAYKASNSLRFGYTLERALNFSVENVPVFRGITLVLIDCSGSMRYDAANTINNWEKAAVFGSAIAHKNPNATDVYLFSNNAIRFNRGKSILQSVESIGREGEWGGTYLSQSLRQTYSGQDRVIIITDEQAHDQDDLSYITDRKPIYTFNVAGYKTAWTEQGKNNSYVFGGLTDAGFKMIEALESLNTSKWPWEN